MSAESLQSAVLWCMVQNFVATAIMIPFVALLCRAFHHRPAMQCLLWTIVLVKFLLPPLPQMAWRVPGVDSLFQGHASANSADPNDVHGTQLDDGQAISADELAAVRADLAGRVQVVPDVRSSLMKKSLLAVIGMWMAGAIAVLVVQAARIRRMVHIIRSGFPATKDLAETVNDVARRMRAGWLLTIVAPRIVSPFLCCLGRLRLVWPGALADCRADAVRAIVAHEIAHVRRRDHWVAWLECCCSIVWWWNPLFWFAKNRLRSSMEMACDATALAAFPEDRCLYAETLLWLSVPLETGAPPLAMAVRGAGPGSLERRLRMIVSIQASEKRPLLGIVAAALLALASIPSLTIAQTPDEKSAARVRDANESKELRVADEDADVKRAAEKRDVIRQLDAEIQNLEKQKNALRSMHDVIDRVGATATKSNAAAQRAIVRGQDGKDVEVLIEENGRKTHVSGKTIILRDGNIAEVQGPNPSAASDPIAVRSTYGARIATGQVDAKQEAGSRALPTQNGPGLDSNGEYRVIRGINGGSLQIERWYKRPGEDPRMIERSEVSPDQRQSFLELERARKADTARRETDALTGQAKNTFNSIAMGGASAAAGPAGLPGGSLKPGQNAEMAGPSARRTVSDEKAVDLVSLATAYADAVAGVEVATDSAAKQRADRKVRVLAKIAQLELEAALEECKRIERLAAAGGAVSHREIKELQSRCAILNEILSMTPKASANPGANATRLDMGASASTPATSNEVSGSIPVTHAGRTLGLILQMRENAAAGANNSSTGSTNGTSGTSSKAMGAGTTAVQGAGTGNYNAVGGSAATNLPAGTTGTISDSGNAESIAAPVPGGASASGSTAKRP